MTTGASNPLPPQARLGIAGAGTMGAGIAQLAVLCDAEAVLVADPVAASRERASALVNRGLQRMVERQRIDGALAERALRRLRLVATPEDLGECDFVIEAAPEQLELKQELFCRVAAAAGPECVLATNTSSLSVTAIASGVPAAQRVVGMHFFNPAPLMRLVEVVAGLASSESALALARGVAERMGKRVIAADDTPGFVVNRCNRPFGLEALRVVEEGLATPEQVDRICRMGGGFRMGPFEFMDLVGTDVSLAVSKSFYEQSFAEPRWQPSLLAARMAAAGRHGRKSGHGWYRYPPGSGRYRPDDPPAPAVEPGCEHVVIRGDGALAAGITRAAEAAGWDVSLPGNGAAVSGSLIIDCDGGGSPPIEGGLRVVLCERGGLGGLDPDGRSVGFFALAPFEMTRLVEMTRTPNTPDALVAAGERFFISLGKHVEWVGDAPGLILGRIVSQLINEAAFAFGSGVASANDIDAGMVLGLNHPRGPLAWGDAIGAPRVLRVLDGLCDEYREPRYRPAPALVRAARYGTPLAEERGE